MANALSLGARFAPAKRIVLARVLPWLSIAALAAICAYALAMITGRVFFTSITNDDGYYAFVSRNFAEGRGYITNYGETARTFNPEVSMGPAIILPGAFLQFVLGSHFWVANIIVPLIVLPLAGAIGWLLYRKFGVSLLGLAVLGVLAFAFTDERNDQGDIVRPFNLWAHQMSDIPALGFTLLAALLATMGDRRPKVHLLAGVLLGLGFYSRVTVVLAGPGFALVYAWMLWRERDARPLLALAAGGLAVAVPMELFRLAALGSPGAYVDNIRDFIHFYQDWGFEGGSHDVHALLAQTSLTIGLFALLAWGGVVGLDWARRKQLTAQESRVLLLGVLLLIAAAVHLYWWLVINDAGWTRHAIPAFMYLAVAGTTLASHVRWRVTPFVTVALVAVLIATQWGAITQYKLITSRDSRLQAELDASAVVNEQAGPGVSFWGCGWWGNRDVAFVGDVHFYDCLDAASVWKHLDAGEELILVRSEFWNWENNPVLTSIAADCDRRTIFQEWPFFVCDATPWLRANTARAGAG